MIYVDCEYNIVYNILSFFIVAYDSKQNYDILAETFFQRLLIATLSQCEKKQMSKFVMF